MTSIPRTAELVATAARTALDRLDDQLGAAGRAAMIDRPWLLAWVDQHAAAVREALGGAPRPACERLAAYADGVLDTAAQHGWEIGTAVEAGWDLPSWPLVRLLAVTTLAG